MDSRDDSKESVLMPSCLLEEHDDKNMFVFVCILLLSSIRKDAQV